MAISNCLFSPTSENPPTPRRGRSDFQFGVYLLIHATTHSRDRCTQAMKSQPHSQAHFIFFVPQKIKRACLFPPSHEL
jgi:hypothetical protein